MKKKVAILTAALTAALLTVLALFALTGCRMGPLTPDENTVVIEAAADDEGKTLLSVMEELKAEGLLSFTVAGGMVTELNGTAQTTSSYWMLYTSDGENANEQWGTFEYEGERLGSAALGAGELTVKAGCLYIWSFESFGL